MTFVVIWHPKARESMGKLDKTVSARIFRKIDSIRNDPLHYAEYMKTYKVYKLRVGDYRILIDIDFEKRSIEVQVVEHRRRIYKYL